MMWKFRSTGLLIFPVILIFLVIQGCSFKTPTPSEVVVRPAQTASEKPEHSALAYCAIPVQVPYYPAPTTMDLCGEPVPLQSGEVYERFDKEFTTIVYNHAQVYLWLKRMERWFPMIEERLKQMNLPDDLKWVAIVESDLVPNVCSPKGAAGPWQFMPSTGSAYGLSQRGSVDKRYDFERATDGAFQYLGDLYRKYKSWSLAIASYNCGEKRIYDAFTHQGTRDYYHMKLPQETERYVIRILAIKAVLGNPNMYGYDLPKGMGYQELKLDRITVNLSRPVSIQTIAANANVTVREFKRLNPIFRSEDIPPGAQELKFPEGFGKVFEANFKSGSAQTTAVASAREDFPAVSAAEPVSSKLISPPPPAKLAPAPAGKVKIKPVKARFYKVKKGDTLSGIADNLDVEVGALKKANHLKTNVLKPGQQLLIP